MPAYMIHTVNAPTLWEEENGSLQRVLDEIQDIVESFGGVYRTRLGTFEVLAGGIDADHLSLIEFPTMADLRDFYDSEQYRPYSQARVGTLLIFNSDVG